ncbi:MAG: glycosyltransferase family 9 protein [Bacteroidota bacterium]
MNKNSKLFLTYIRWKTWALNNLLLPLADQIAAISPDKAGQIQSGISVKNTGKPSLLVVRLDAIGDYILFRNFLPVLRQHPKYQTHSITLCGNILWKDIAETFDREHVDHFIWVDKKKLVRKPLYRLRMMRKLAAYSFDTIIQPAYQRDYFTDAVVRAPKSEERIACIGGTGNAGGRHKRMADALFTKLLPSADGNMFEFMRNREFFSQLLPGAYLPAGTSITPNQKGLAGLPEKYIILFPGASAAFKQWPAANFAEVAKKLHAAGEQLVIAGSPADSVLAADIIRLSGLSTIINLCGKTGLTDLVSLIAGAQLLLCGDTGAYHIGAATGIKVLCINNATYYKIFMPYPPEMGMDIGFIYPPEVDALSEDERVKRFGGGPVLDIKSISVEKVMLRVNESLKELEKFKQAGQ